MREAQDEYREKKNFTAAQSRMNFEDYLASKEQQFYDRQMQKQRESE